MEESEYVSVSQKETVDSAEVNTEFAYKACGEDEIEDLVGKEYVIVPSKKSFESCEPMTECACKPYWEEEDVNNVEGDKFELGCKQCEEKDVGMIDDDKFGLLYKPLGDEEVEIMGDDKKDKKEVLCNPCKEDAAQKEPIKYYPDCQEYPCEKCARQHGRRSATSSHKLVDASEAKLGDVLVTTLKCRCHGDRYNEMYCEAHDMVYCTKCIATEHRSCRGVVCIEDVELRSLQDEQQTLFSETIGIEKQLKTTTNRKLAQLERLEEGGYSGLKVTEDVSRGLNGEGEIPVFPTEDMNTQCSDIRRNLESDINDIKRTSSEVEMGREMVATMGEMDFKQQFVIMKCVNRSVTEWKKLVEEDKSIGGAEKPFMKETPLDSAPTRKLTSLKAYLASKRNGGIKVVSKRESDLHHHGNERKSYISDFCQLPDGTVLLSDFNNTKVIKLDSNYNIVDHCDLEACPTGICYVGENAVAVKLNNDKIQFISLGISMEKSRHFTIENGCYVGLTYFNGELWVSNKRGIDVYSTSGKLLKSIRKGKRDRDIFKNNVEHMVVMGDTVIVTDSCDGAVILGRDHAVKNKLWSTEKLSRTGGVAISEDGIVFISGFASNNIVMFEYGVCIGELISEKDGIHKPMAICFDKDKNCLFVSRADSDKLTILTLR